jgi:biopolymer transport protein ExbD
MAFARAGNTQGQPMSEMNTTPLIDVMLVLLIMFIITIPVATHTTDFAVGGGEPVDPRMIRHDINRLQITAADRLVWNGQPISERQLAALLHQSALRPIEPELQYEPEAQASYDLAARVAGEIKRSGVTHFGFVGNDRFADFGKAAGAR